MVVFASVGLLLVGISTVREVVLPTLPIHFPDSLVPRVGIGNCCFVHC